MCAVSEASAFAAPCELPEFIRDSLDIDSATTCSFNPFGTLLAVGTSSGHVYIWEMEMLSPAATLDVGHHRIVQIDWSDDGHFVVVLSNSTVTRIELLHATQKREVFMYEHEIAAMDLNRSTPHQCILTLSQHDVCSILSFHRVCKDPIQLPTLLKDSAGGEKGCNGKMHEVCRALPMAVFDETGTKIVHAYRDGWICIYDAASLKILDIYALPMGCKIIGLQMERQAQEMIVYLLGKCPMIFQLHPAAMTSSTARPLSVKEGRERMKIHARNAKGGSLRDTGPPWLTLKCRLQHPLGSVTGVSWDVGCLLAWGGAAKYALTSTSAGTASPFAQQHLLHVWDIETGEIERILEGTDTVLPSLLLGKPTCIGPKEAVQHICWHETSRSAVSVSDTGKVYIWSKRHREYWSVFDSGFEEIRENEEYVESETEFDCNDRAAARVEQGDERLSMCTPGQEDSEELDVFGSPLSPIMTEDTARQQPLLHLPVVFTSFTMKAKEEVLQKTGASPEPMKEPEAKEQEDLFKVEDSPEAIPVLPRATDGKRLKVRLSPSRSVYSRERRRHHRRRY